MTNEFVNGRLDNIEMEQRWANAMYLGKSKETKKPSEIMKEYFSYDPESGIIRWIKDGGWNAKAGTIAGSPQGGAIRICLKQAQYQGQDVAWALHHGKWPQYRVIAKDGDRTNLRISNLELTNRKRRKGV